MEGDGKITQAELDALAAAYAIPNVTLETARSKILVRSAVIGLLWTIRLIIVIFYPEYHLMSVAQERFVPPEYVESFLHMRIILLIAGSGIYFYLLYINRYFRQIHLVGLLVLGLFLLSDIQSYIVYSNVELGIISIAMVSMRFAVLALLLLNYRDVRA